MANATTSYSDWLNANPSTVSQVAAQVPAAAPIAAAPATADRSSMYADSFAGRNPVFDQAEYAKSQQSDARNDAVAAGEDPNKKKSNVMGNVLGLVGTFFGGPIGAALGAAGGMFGGGKEAEETASGGDGSSPQRSNVAQNYLSSFMKR